MPSRRFGPTACAIRGRLASTGDTGDLYIADIGQNMWEEVDFQPASSKGGENYGWSLTCGVHSFPIEKGPADHWIGYHLARGGVKHGQDGDCVVGNRGVPRKSLTPIEGDLPGGRLGFRPRLGLNAVAGESWAMQELLNTQLQLTCGGEDEKGNLYVANATSQYGAYKDPFSNPPGSVWRVVLASKVPNGAKTAPLDK